MQRGNLVIYDATGKIFSQTGEAEGDVLPHEYPIGLPYIEIPFGTMESKKLISINVTKEPHEPIFEDIVQQPTYEELENQLLLAQEGLL